MDIICPECHTEYEFDDDRVSDAGVTVKCTNCSYTFKVRRKQPGSPPPFKGEEIGADDDKLWMIRTADGGLLHFRELTTLQQWIVEHKVTASDQISRSGETWKRLGDIAELSTFFEVVQAAKSIQVKDGAAASPADNSDQAERSEGAEPAFAASTMRFDAVGERAAWEGGGGRVGAAVENERDELLPRRSPGRLIGIILVVLVIASVAGFAAVKPEAVKGLFASLMGKEQVSAAYTKGRELFLRDDAISLAAAEKELAKAPKESALARAARAEVYTTWAQHLRDEAELREREANAAERAAAAALEALKKAPKPKAERKKRDRKSAKTPDTSSTKAAQTAAMARKLSESAKALRLRAAALKQEAEGKLKVAQVHVEAALASKSERAEVHRAVADLHRLQGKGDVPALLAMVRTTAPDDPEAFYVEGMFIAAQGDQSRAIKLLKTAILKTKAFSKQLLLRANFSLGMIHLRAGRRTEAQQQADMILAANPKHAWARQLLGRVGAEAQAGNEAQATNTTPRPGTGPSAGRTADTAPAKIPPAAGAATAAALPNNYPALIKAGDKASEYGRSGKALRYYEKALKLKPRGIEALVGLAYCEMDVQRFSSALSRFRQALNISATYPDAMLGMAEVYKSLGNKRKALDYFKAFVRAHPNSSKASRARRNVETLEAALGISGKTEPAPAAPAPVTPAPEPAKPEPAQPEPAQPEPAQPEPAKPEPAPAKKPEPAPAKKPEPAPAKKPEPAPAKKPEPEPAG